MKFSAGLQPAPSEFKPNPQNPNSPKPSPSSHNSFPRRISSAATK
jgi:hypothetical protein